MPLLTREIAVPSSVTTHRAAVSAADSGAPSASSFAANPNDARLARLWVDVSFTGGTSPTLDLTPWFKPAGASVPLGQGEAVEYGGADGLPAGAYVIDVDAHGCDLFAYLDNVQGSPSAFAVTVYVLWL